MLFGNNPPRKLLEIKSFGVDYLRIGVPFSLLLDFIIVYLIYYVKSLLQFFYDGGKWRYDLLFA